MKNLVVFALTIFSVSLSFADSTLGLGNLGLSCDRFSAEGCYDSYAIFDHCNIRKINTSEGQFLEYNLKESRSNSSMSFRVSAKLPLDDQGVKANAVAINVNGLPQSSSLICMAPHSQQYQPYHYWICYGGESMNSWGDKMEFSIEDSYCAQNDETDAK